MADKGNLLIGYEGDIGFLSKRTVRLALVLQEVMSHAHVVTLCHSGSYGHTTVFPNFEGD